MYSKILEYDLKELEDDEITTFFKNFRDVVGSVILLFDSLSANALSKVCDIEIEDVCNILNSLRSVLDIPKSLNFESLDCPIRLFHLSFREFLLDKKRCPNHELRINKPKKHNDLFVSCLTLMSTHLKMDICNLRLPGALASGVEKSRVEECLPLSVQYACRYWVYHLQQGNINLCDNGQIHTFLQKHFLHWLEALSLIKKMSEGVLMVKVLQSMVSVSIHI